MNSRKNKRRAAVKAQNQLVLSCLKLAHLIAYRFRHHGLDHEELVSVCHAALVRAAASPTFDPNCCKFSTYAGKVMTTALTGYVTAHRQCGMVGARRKADPKNFDERSYCSRYTRVVDDDARSDVVSRAPTRKQCPPLAWTEEQWAIVLGGFSERNRVILTMYYRRQMTLQAIADRLRVTKQAVHQVIHRCTNKLRAVVEANADELLPLEAP